MRVTARSSDAVVSPMDLKGSKQAVSRNTDDGAGASAGALDRGTNPPVTAFAAGEPRARRDSWKRNVRFIVAFGWKRFPKRRQQPKRDVHWRRAMRALSRQWKTNSRSLYCSMSLVSRCVRKLELRNLLSSISRQSIIFHRLRYFAQDWFTMRFLQHEGRRVQRLRITGACTLARRTAYPR